MGPAGKFKIVMYRLVLQVKCRISTVYSVLLAMKFRSNKYLMTAVVHMGDSKGKVDDVEEENETWNRLMLSLYLRKAPEKRRERRSMPKRVMKV